MVVVVCSAWLKCKVWLWTQRNMKKALGDSRVDDGARWSSMEDVKHVWRHHHIGDVVTAGSISPGARCVCRYIHTPICADLSG